MWRTRFTPISIIPSKQVHDGEDRIAEYDFVRGSLWSTRRSQMPQSIRSRPIPLTRARLTACFAFFNKGVGFFAGTATVEAFATDAVKGTLLWEAVDKRGGTTALVADTLDNWRDVRNAFQAWGVQLRTRLQDLGVCRR